jgi:hypothetical protein
MQIFTLSKAKLNASKIYSLSLKDKKIIDKKFDCLYIEKKILQITQFTKVQLFYLYNIANC